MDEAPVADEARGPPPRPPRPRARRPSAAAARGRDDGGARQSGSTSTTRSAPQPTRVSVDGQSLGEVGARKKTSVRTHAGPREICALPVSDARSCGDPGTIRKAYLHEGWSLTVHCDK